MLPLKLSSKSEPYELVTRRGAPVSAGARVLMEELLAQHDHAEDLS